MASDTRFGDSTTARAIFDRPAFRCIDTGSYRARTPGVARRRTYSPTVSVPRLATMAAEWPHGRLTAEKVSEVHGRSLVATCAPYSCSKTTQEHRGWEVALPLALQYATTSLGVLTSLFVMLVAATFTKGESDKEGHENLLANKDAYANS